MELQGLQVAHQIADLAGRKLAGLAVVVTAATGWIEATGQGAGAAGMQVRRAHRDTDQRRNLEAAIPVPTETFALLVKWAPLWQELQPTVASLNSCLTAGDRLRVHGRGHGERGLRIQPGRDRIASATSESFGPPIRPTNTVVHERRHIGHIAVPVERRRGKQSAAQVLGPPRAGRHEVPHPAVVSSFGVTGNAGDQSRRVGV